MAEITGKGTRRKPIVVGPVTSVGWRIDWKGNRIYRFCIADIATGEMVHVELTAQEKELIASNWANSIAEGV